MKIVLIGYMGSGKTKVGKLLASHLNVAFCDLDEHIVQKAGKEITGIFSENGEIYFRKLESECLREVLVSKKCQVIALGGGTPCYGDNLELMRQHDVQLIYLKANLKTLTDRLFEEKETRPMISHYIEKKALEDFIRKHLFERNYFYMQSDLIIEIEGKSMGNIANEMEKLLK